LLKEKGIQINSELSGGQQQSLYPEHLLINQIGFWRGTNWKFRYTY